MRIKFLSLVLAPAALAAAILTVQPALADSTYTVHVPFNFVVAGKTLPAGDYTVRRGDRAESVTLAGHNNAMIWGAGPGSPNPSDHRVVLTFDRIGASHMLRTVQFGSVITSRIDSRYAHSLAAEEQIAAGE